jgi:hypothetical protein
MALRPGVATTNVLLLVFVVNWPTYGTHLGRLGISQLRQAAKAQHDFPPDR